jgi:phage terminase Nu1 subunit (DNA packaging protein)
MSLSQIAQIFELSDSGLRKWGLAPDEDGKYDIRDAVRHLRARSEQGHTTQQAGEIDRRVEDARLTKFKAATAELEFHEASKNLVNAQDVIEGYRDILSVLRSAFRSMPMKLAKTLEFSEAGFIQSKISNEIDAILNNVVDKISKK